jgi:hypothetical protein
MLFAGTANAYVTTNEELHEISVWGDVGKNLTWLTSQVGDESIITEGEPGIFYTNYSIRLYTSGTTATMYINDSDCTELRMSNIYNEGLESSIWYIDNTKIVSWNHTAGRPAHNDEAQVTVATNGGWMYDCNVSNLGGITVANPQIAPHNITATDCYAGIKFSEFTGLDIYDIDVRDTVNLWGIWVQDVYYSDIYNIRAENIGSHLNPGTYQHGLAIEAQCGDIDIRDVYINDTGWSSLLISGNSTNITAENITVGYSGHNGLDIHWATNVSVNNITITDSVSNNAIVTYANVGTDYQTHDISVTDYYSANSGIDQGFKVGVAKNVTLTNYTSVNDGVGIGMFDCDNVKLINGTITDAGVAISMTWYSAEEYSTYNASFIDVNIINAGTEINHYYADDTILANVNFSSVDYNTGDYTVLYPLNVRVLNTTDYPVQDANLTLTVTTFGLDGLGEYFVNTTTDENGYPVSPIYVPDYLYDGSYTYYNLNTVTAEKSGESYTSSAFNPDSTWYSTDSSEPNGTLITLTLDVPGEGGEPAVEYFYGNTDYSYLDYPEVLEWNSTLGIFTKRFLLDGTILEEDAPERVTGVEVRP